MMMTNTFDLAPNYCALALCALKPDLSIEAALRYVETGRMKLRNRSITSAQVEEMAKLDGKMPHASIGKIFGLTARGVGRRLEKYRKQLRAIVAVSPDSIGRKIYVQMSLWA